VRIDHLASFCGAVILWTVLGGGVASITLVEAEAATSADASSAARVQSGPTLRVPRGRSRVFAEAPSVPDGERSPNVAAAIDIAFGENLHQGVWGEQPIDARALPVQVGAPGVIHITSPRPTAAHVTGLAVTLLPDEADRLAANETQVPAAYDAQLHWLMNQWQFEEMRPVIERMAATDPNYAETYTWRSTLALFDGDADSAIGHLRAGLRLDPLGASRLRQLGRAHLQAGRYEEAIVVLERGRPRDPDDPERLPPMAAAYALDGRTTKAQDSARGSCLRPANPAVTW
jgi:hypothetical protein